MKLPTQKEMEDAHSAISREGPMAETTLKLGKLAQESAVLRGWVERVVSGLVGTAKDAPESADSPLWHGALTGALISGLNLGLRIGEARQSNETVSAAVPPGKTPAVVQATSLYAWIGEDEHGSGEIGIKQSLVPAGLIPMAAIKREKMERHWAAAEMQAAAYGKRIRLCRYAFAEILKETQRGE